MSGTNQLLDNENAKRDGDNSRLIKALENANEEAIKQDRKDAPKLKK